MPLQVKRCLSFLLAFSFMLGSAAAQTPTPQPKPSPPGARTLTLPNNDKIRIMAVTLSDEGGQLRPTRPLYDTLERSAP